MNVSLRKISLADLDLFEEHLGSAEGTGDLQWFGLRTSNAIRRQWAEDGLINSEGGRLTIEADGQTAGYIRWSKAIWGPPDSSWNWHLGILVLPHARGKGVGTQAHILLVDYLFAHTRAERIEATTDVRNLAEQRALEKAGFEREGVLRRAQWRDGRWHDQIIYSTLRNNAE
ncbi:GNAT family N-acetyltransferase [Nonomuraea sp. NPDC050556]|uniref:GNAT family N-acetyltransferase n=1 Tax=Nonomuraea sp. NPDC050556 TaxID=3364369 RepID=UPI0037B11C16